jgi:ankyrin repeat protein
MNFHFHITIDKNGVSQTTASHEKIETRQLTEEEKIENIVRMFRDRNMPDNLVKQDCYLNDIKEKIGQLSNVNLFVKSTGQCDMNLLFHASRENCPEAIDMLLEKGADPLLINNTDRSVLHLMAKNGQVEMAEKCIYNVPWDKRDGFINKYSGWTPLMAAAENNQLEFVKWLLRPPCRAEINKTMKTGWTAMHAAAKKNNGDIVKFLLQYGGDWKIKASHRDYGNFLSVRDVTSDYHIINMFK